MDIDLHLMELHHEQCFRTISVFCTETGKLVLNAHLVTLVINLPYML